VRSFPVDEVKLQRENTDVIKPSVHLLVDVVCVFIYALFSVQSCINRAKLTYVEMGESQLLRVVYTTNGTHD
jgi:hypothetical protein